MTMTSMGMWKEGRDLHWRQTHSALRTIAQDKNRPEASETVTLWCIKFEPSLERTLICDLEMMNRWIWVPFHWLRNMVCKVLKLSEPLGLRNCETKVRISWGWLTSVQSCSKWSTFSSWQWDCLRSPCSWVHMLQSGAHNSLFTGSFWRLDTPNWNAPQVFDILKWNYIRGMQLGWRQSLSCLATAFLDQLPTLKFSSKFPSILNIWAFQFYKIQLLCFKIKQLQYQIPP